MAPAPWPEVYSSNPRENRVYHNFLVQTQSSPANFALRGRSDHSICVCARTHSRRFCSTTPCTISPPLRQKALCNPMYRSEIVSQCVASFARQHPLTPTYLCAVSVLRRYTQRLCLAPDLGTRAILPYATLVEADASQSFA